MRATLILASAVAALVAVACYGPTLQSPGYFCHVDDNPACPEGQICGANGRCVFATGVGAGDMSGGLIPKTMSYSGLKSDPMLTSTAMCPDTALEPNDDPMTARTPGPVNPGAPPVLLDNLAICPTGINPATGKHDRDFIAIDTSGTTGQLSLRAEITYDVKYGDLDVGVMDSTGQMLAMDNTAVANGCVLAGVMQGIYYVVVVGALDTDVNRYRLKIQTAQTPNMLSCTTTTPPKDML